MKRQRITTFAAAAVLFVIAVLLVLGFRGSLFPVLPNSVTSWWLQRAIPLGTPYEAVRTTVRERGWRESSGTWTCTPAPNGHGAFMTVELGHVAVGLPLVKYAYANFTFGGDCRVRAIETLTEIDGP
jgi:hypothetical protein